MVRLGKKYELRALRVAAEDRIRQALPRCVESFAKIVSDELASGNHYSMSGHEIDMINLLEGSDLQSLLPLASYVCIKNLSLVGQDLPFAITCW